MENNTGGKIPGGAKHLPGEGASPVDILGNTQGTSTSPNTKGTLSSPSGR